MDAHNVAIPVLDLLRRLGVGSEHDVSRRIEGRLEETGHAIGDIPKDQRR